jgi:hypothetical protein
MKSALSAAAAFGSSAHLIDTGDKQPRTVQMERRIKRKLLVRIPVAADLGNKSA